MRAVTVGVLTMLLGVALGAAAPTGVALLAVVSPAAMTTSAPSWS
jgi:hypothetical protein